MKISPASPAQKGGSLRVARRVAQIMGVLARHKILGALRGRNHWPPPAEVRKAFEELGLVFLKFGQVLAMRRDLLAEPYIRELERLQDQLPPIPFHTVQATVERQLGKPLDRLFRSFEREPRATATIAQVHEARLRDGRHVVVKVRRPGLEAVIAEDIATLRYLALLLESLFPKLLDVGLAAMVVEFENTLHRETDFRREARNIRRFRAAWARFRGVWIPDVVPARSNAAVLTMVYSPGTRIDAYAKRHPGRTKRQCSILVNFMLRSILEDGVFHADPHPGNVFVLPDGRISLVDFGMIGELDESTRDSLTHLLDAVVQSDPSGVVNSYLEMAELSGHVDRSALKSKVRNILQDMHGLEPSELSFGNTLAALLRAGTECGVRSSAAFFLLTRVFVILESELRRLDPDVDLIAAFQREDRRLAARHLSLARIARDSGRAALGMERFALEAPDNARRMLRQMAEGSLGQVQVPGLEALAAHINSDIQHLTVAVAGAGLVVGGSTLAAVAVQNWRSVVGDVVFFCGLLTIFVIGLRSLRRALARRFAAWGPSQIEPLPPE